MDEPNDHAIALSMAQAVEADAELIATLIHAIPEAGDGADHSGLDDETYRTLQAFNVAAQQGESTGAEAELSHEETHEASSVAGGDGTGVESATGDDSQSDADNQSYDTAPRDDVSQRDEGEIQGEEIQPEETQEEGDADDQPETTQVASPAPSELYVETKECLYCSDEFPIDMIFEAPCSHAMCQPCLIRSIRTAIKDESLFPPKCCGQAIPVDTTNTFIPEELLTECDNKREEYETTNRTYCSDKACSEFIPLRSIEAGIARCTRCETRTCLNCLSEAHEGTCTDDPESQRVIRLAEEHGWRRCEQCKNMVELTHGCFHISWIQPVLLASCLLAESTNASFNYEPEDQAVLSPNNDAAQSKPKTNNGGKKNIVFILTDDQDAVLNSVSYMPKLKEHIIDKGTSFVNHFTTTAICCPSRVALWTGKQPHNTNVTDVNPPYGGFPKFVSQGLNENYLPVWLKEAGYNTYYTGKLFNAHTINNYNSPYPAGWTGTNFLLDPGTYDYLNPIYQHNQEPPVQHKGVHTSDLISKYAHELLKEAIDAENPFFVAIAPVAPHSNVNLRRQPGNPSAPLMTIPIPLERHSHLFEGVKVPRTENFNPDSPSGVSWIHKLAQLNDSSVSYLDDFYRARLQALQGVDEIVEQVTKQLEDAGILDETYIIYSSDNGYHLGQHRLPPGKECGFDEDIRVPLFIRGPGVSSGSIENAVTTHIDLAPTILRLAGADLRSDFDGTPIPVLPTQENKRHEHVAVEYWGGAIAEGEIGGFDGKGQIFAQNNTYKGVRIVHEDYNLYYSAWCNNEHELYDLKTDPGQLKSLFPHDDTTADSTLLGTTARQVLNRLDALMLVLKSCKGNTCIEPWKILHPEGGVTSLKDALQAKFNAFYKEQVKVRFDRCEYGYLIDAEGPQVGYEYREGLEWHHWT
ncbi:hypothetical protein HZS61_016211 [Fusarium oxysporum f. sp. conglutinans]|uniref:Arylsulfatase n=1 Tax=Fusarium oxysporum f. sp. conglutinans TaxID=100902 RepID=A0A8H6GK00_FUSOX|nr:hypothetical protein HZS61_016211 [Fusarium oxysporum f. sp. conglutinans]